MAEATKKINITAPFAKVEKTEDGGREVWGFATLERVDKSGEIIDFDGTVKAFEKWADDTTIRSQGKSKGNIRIMHQPITGGKVIHWEPTETTIEENGVEKEVKGIWLGSYVPPTKEDVIKDIDEGILTAYSIGGSYADRRYDSSVKAFRFTPEIAETSFVDNPCVEGADFINVISKSAGPWTKSERNLRGGEILDEPLKKGAPTGSIEELQERIREACADKFKALNENWWNGDLIGTFPDKNEVIIIDWHDEKTKYYLIPYEDKDDQILLGEAAELERIEDYIPKETLKTILAEIEKMAAKKRLEGGENKIMTPTAGENKTKKGAEKMNKEDVQKAAETAGVSLEQAEKFLKALTPIDQAPEKVETTDTGIAKDAEKAADTDKLEKEAKSKDKADAEKEDAAKDDMDKEADEEKCDKCGGPLKDGKCDKCDKEEKADKSAETEELAKAGKAISTKNQTHLTHAINYIKAAIDDVDYHPDMMIDESSTKEGTNTGMEAPNVTTKSFGGNLQKAMGTIVTGELAKAVDKIETLLKSVAGAEPLAKAVETINGMAGRMDTLEKMVKEIHEAPAGGGPILGGANPLIEKMMKGAGFTGTDMAQTEDQLLEKLVSEATNPMIKDHLSQELTKRRMKNVF